MQMNVQQKQYIENNITLIDNNEWIEFFDNAPNGTAGVIYESGIDFLTKITELKHVAFYRSSITSIELPDNITTIGNECFERCENLQRISFGNSIKELPSFCCAGCPELVDVELGVNVNTIGSYAFDGCTNLEKIIIPDGVKSLHSSTFMDCSNLTFVQLPETLTFVGFDVFHDCSADLQIKFGGTKAKWRKLMMGKVNYQYVCECSDGIVSVK